MLQVLELLKGLLAELLVELFAHLLELARRRVRLTRPVELLALRLVRLIQDLFYAFVQEALRFIDVLRLQLLILRDQLRSLLLQPFQPVELRSGPERNLIDVRLDEVLVWRQLLHLLLDGLGVQLALRLGQLAEILAVDLRLLRHPEQGLLLGGLHRLVALLPSLLFFAVDGPRCALAVTGNAEVVVHVLQQVLAAEIRPSCPQAQATRVAQKRLEIAMVLAEGLRPTLVALERRRPLELRRVGLSVEA